MTRLTRPPVRIAAGPALRLRWVGPALVGLLTMMAVSPAWSRDPAPYAARAGLDAARVGAAAWAPDAFLVYVENDEPLDASGAADRWGYLFFSPSLDRSRAYSIRDGRIVVAENLDMKLEAPPLATDWIDSHVALEAAGQAAREFCEKEGGRLSAMLLMRGAFHEKEPDQTTWMVVYAAPNAPSLFVVVDASAGKVRRTWRG